MPKSATPRNIVKILQQHGFLLKRTRGSHQIFQHPENKRRVLVAFHEKDIPKGTLHAILEQAGLSLDDL